MEKARSGIGFKNLTPKGKRFWAFGASESLHQVGWSALSFDFEAIQEL